MFSAAFAAPYVILDTDYDNYSCIYSCIGNNFGYHADFAFIFSRKPSLSDGYAKKCQEAFSKIGVDLARFTTTTQGAGCPYDAQQAL